MIDITGLREDKRPQSSTIVHALLDRLEAAEKELAELRSSMKFRTSLIGRTEAERDALRAKIAEMERQEPVAWAATDETCRIVEALGFNPSKRFDTPLYLFPGAKGEDK